MKINSADVESLISKLLRFPNADSHKGSMGKVCVIGGHKNYTGAPYFSAISALRMGCDLAYIICPPKAATAIKSYSPDIIVLPILIKGYYDKFEDYVDIMDSFVIGPGLGRDPYLSSTVRNIIDRIIQRKKPVVIDADALWHLSQKTTLPNLETAILTPNFNELRQLAKFINNDQNITPQLVSEKMSNVWIMSKGKTDKITNSHHEFEYESLGSPRRCGGQGDILCGILATILAWNTKGMNYSDPNIPLYAASALCASHIIRFMAAETFSKVGPTFIASDIISQMPNILRKIYNN